MAQFVEPEGTQPEGATGDEVVTLSQFKVFTDSLVDSGGGGGNEGNTGGFASFTGKEALTLKQLRNSFGGGSNKKYKIEWSSDTDAAYRSNQTEAEPGSIVPCCSKDGQTKGAYAVYDSSKPRRIIMWSRTTSSSEVLSDLPEIVQEAIYNMPEQARLFEQTRAVPPPMISGFGWFVMPACDVYVALQG